MLYLLDFRLDDAARGDPPELFPRWRREAEAARAAAGAGGVLDLWKCVGQRRVLAVVDVDALDALDHLLSGLPSAQEHRPHLRVDVTPLRRLDDRASIARSDRA